MNILIIEDEAVAADRLESMLQEVMPDCRIMAKIGSVKESVKWLQKNTADIIFLDIQLSDGLSFSIFDQVAVSTPVIFTTAYDQYAVKAFQLNSVDYLLKPVRSKDLNESLQKLQSMKSAFSIDFEDLFRAYQGLDHSYKKRFLIRIGDHYKKIEVKEIAYFFAMEKSIFFKTFKNKTLTIDYTLDSLEEIMDPSQFFRINRKYLINMDAIDKMVAWGRGRILLNLNPSTEKDMDAIVSMERSADFKKWINS
jgi:DNA-binding LytR/AlgR family response regulator